MGQQNYAKQSKGIKKVSVIITLYNFKKYIKEAIDSVVDQTYKDWELIIVDDASTDGSCEFVESYIKTLSGGNIRLIKNLQNLGVGKAFENGLVGATGDYIAILDADDVWVNDKLYKQINFMETNDLDMSYHDLLVTDDTLKVKNISFIRNFLQIDANKIENTPFEFIIKGNHCTGSSIIFKRNIINKLIPFPQNIYQDYRVSTVCSLYGKLGFLDCTLTYYRQHGNNLVGALKNKKSFWDYIVHSNILKQNFKKEIFMTFDFLASVKRLDLNKELLKLVEEKLSKLQLSKDLINGKQRIKDYWTLFKNYGLLYTISIFYYVN